MLRRVLNGYSYQKEFEHSVRDPQGFWRSQLSRVQWIKEPKIMLDQSRPPFFRWFPDGTTNLSLNCLDRHLPKLHSNMAFHHISPTTQHDYSLTYAQLHDQVSRFAWSLKNEVGVNQGDTVVIYMPMVPEAAIAMLACARIGAIHSVVFGGFAAPELASRLKDTNAKVVISCSFGMDGAKKLLYKPIVDQALKIAEINNAKTIIFQRDGEKVNHTDFDFYDLLKQKKHQEAVELPSNHPAYILYTSGTTGSPKGYYYNLNERVVRDVGGIAMSLNYVCDKVMDIHEKDVLFSSSDIGWVVGHSFNIYGPLLRGATAVLYEGKPVGTPDAGQFWRIIQQKNVKHLYTAPTAIRVIRKEDIDGNILRKFNLSSLKGVSFAGERCDIPTYKWLRDNLPGVFINDNFWQTETGYPVISNYLNLTTFPFKPGSATKPVPGFNVKVLDHDGNECQVGQMGKVCIKFPTPPTFALTLWNKDQQFIEKYFSEYDGYYFTGDAGYVDEDGYYHIMTRLDDIINTAGHRLSTAQMEEIIMTIPNVSEAIVVGVQDEIKGEIPVGFVTVQDGLNVIEKNKIQKAAIDIIRKEIGPVASFKHCIVVSKLPKTRSGKYLRNVVRAMANGQAYKTPATIEDDTILPALHEQIKGLNLSVGIQYEETPK